MKRSLNRKFLTLWAYALVFCQVVNAAPSAEYLGGLNREGADASVRPSNVFVYGDRNMDLLMKVTVIGAVQNTGVHYVPEKTDLVTLISLAGGTAEEANLNKVVIKRDLGGQKQVMEVDLEDLVSDAKADSPILQANDTILVPKNSRVISANLLQGVAFVAGLATIFGTLVLGIKNL
jgi:hypothetical protein